MPAASADRPTRSRSSCHSTSPALRGVIRSAPLQSRHPGQNVVFDRRAWILLAILLPLAPARLAAQAAVTKQVLLVYSHEREMAMYAGFDRAFRSRLQSGTATPIEF